MPKKSIAAIATRKARHQELTAEERRTADEFSDEIMALIEDRRARELGI